MIRVAARKAGLQDFRLFSRTGPSGRIIVEGFSAMLGGGRLSGTGYVDFANPSGPHRMRVELAGVDAMAFLRLLEVNLDATVQTKVDGVFDLQWRGTTGSQARRTLNGAARWSAGRGHVSGADVMLRAAALTGIDQLSGFQLLSAGANGVFRQGILTVEFLRVSGTDQEFSGTGQLDAFTREIQMTLRLRVSPELISSSTVPQVRALGLLAGGVRKAAAAHSGKPERLIPLPIPLTMTGKVQDPQFHFGEFKSADSTFRPKRPSGSQTLKQRKE